MNLARFPRRGYVYGATPLEAAPNLTKALGDKVNIYIKRDDLLPGAGSGNKTRKLDFSIADALAQGADTLVTCGAVQSNHCRLAVAWAKKENMACHLVLEERVPGSYSPEASGNNFLYYLLGADSIRVVPGGSNMPEEMQKTADTLIAQGHKPYIIPGGASNPVGALGYVNCTEEMLRQFFDMALIVDALVVPSGSAGTHAGTVVGMTANNAGIPVLGINVSRPQQAQEELVYTLCGTLAEKLDVPAPARETVTCFDQYVGPGYSRPTDGMIEAVTLFARTEAILLDPVYSGKAAAGFIDLVRKGYFAAGANVVFLHTGGVPALYAYQSVFAGR